MSEAVRTRNGVAVVGAGTMGIGIAVVSILAGHRTLLVDVTPEALDKGIEQITRFLDGSVKRSKMLPNHRDQALEALTGTTDMEDLAECAFVIEAVPEDLGAKMALLATLDDICAPSTIVCSNTSTLSITSIAAGSRRPENVVGTHFCNPAPLMKLVEVVRGLDTSEVTYQRAMAFVHNLGKNGVTVHDTPGFLVNRLLIPFENDCIRALEAKRATAEDIDKVVRLGLGHPLGPFALLDVVGLDVHRDVSNSLFEQLRDPRFAAPPLVDRMIAAGRLGRKTGRGFYTYEGSNVFGA